MAVRLKALRPAGVRDPQALQAFALAAGAGGYEGARKRRALQEWVVSPGSSNADLLPDLPTLRERSRDLDRNMPLARGAIENVVTPVVGPGLVPKAQLDRDLLGLDDTAADAWERDAERYFDAWCERSDFTGVQTFAGQQRLAFRSVLLSGDCLALWRWREPGGPQLQLLEGDRLDEPRPVPGGTRAPGGVEIDGDGRPTAYWVASRHPGDLSLEALRWDRVPAVASNGRRLVLHLFDRRRPDQLRGEPYLAPVIEALKQLGRYTDAELMAAVLGAYFTVFVKSQDNASRSSPLGQRAAPGTDPSTAPNFKLGAGAILNLGPGEDIEVANPGRPNAGFDPFVQAILRQIGVALGQPFEILVKHFTASYSAARAAMLEAWRTFRTWRAWFVDAFCVPVWREVITDGVARGALVAPGFLASEPVRRAYLGVDWIGPAAGQIDPQKEAAANEIMVDRGWKTDAEVTAELTGGDWERKIAQRAREQRRKAELGFDQAAPSPADPTQAAPQDDGGDLEEEDQG